mgnify:CR=1 FL=1
MTKAWASFDFMSQTMKFLSKALISKVNEAAVTADKKIPGQPGIFSLPATIA